MSTFLLQTVFVARKEASGSDAPDRFKVSIYSLMARGALNEGHERETMINQVLEQCSGGTLQKQVACLGKENRDIVRRNPKWRVLLVTN